MQMPPHGPSETVRLPKGVLMLRIVLLAALTSLAVRPATHGPSNDADAATGPDVNVSLRIASQSRIFLTLENWSL